jgi:hypothetical protein
MTTSKSDLERIRAAFVEERRRVARSAVEIGETNNEPWPNLNIAADIISLQDKIESIDRAVADESRLGATSIRPLTG